MLGRISTGERKYNIEGLKGDYYSLLASFRSSSSKKERKQLALWIKQIKEILDEQGISLDNDETPNRSQN